MIKKLIESLDILDVVSSCISLTKNGNNYKGLCPFHSEATPSLVVSPAKQIFKCFGCNEAGDALGFYMKYKKLDFIDAVKELAHRYKIDIKFEKREDDKKDAYFKILSKVSKAYKESLLSEEGKQALAYFESRGFNREDIEKYSLGFTTTLTDKFKEHEKELLELGLIQKREGRIYDTFRNRVIFTIFDVSKNVIGFGARVINQSLPKYINSSDSYVFKKGSNLYGLFNIQAIKEKDFVVLVEGYTDVLSMHKNGFENSVASLGTAFTESQAKYLKKYTSNIVISYDSDSAGKLATEKAILILKKEGFNVKILSLDPFKDPDEFLKKNNSEALKKKIKESKEAFDFLLDSFNDIERDVIGKRKIAYKLKGFFSILRDSLERDIYLGKLSSFLNLSKDVLKEYMKDKQESEKTVSKVLEDKGIGSLELQTLAFLYNNEEYLNKFNLNLFKRSKISFLSEANNDNIKERIEVFVSLFGVKKEFNNWKNIKDIRLLFNDLNEAWQKMNSSNELDDMETLMDFSGNKLELIKDYLLKKRESEN